MYFFYIISIIWSYFQAKLLGNQLVAERAENVEVNIKILMHYNTINSIVKYVVNLTLNIYFFFFFVHICINAHE